MKLVNSSRGSTVSESVLVFDTIHTRLRGLIGIPRLNFNEVAWIKPCNSIHTMFMKYAIDCVFVDRDLKVLHVASNIQPFRLVMPVIQAKSVFEFASQDIGAKLAPGEQLHVVP